MMIYPRSLDLKYLLEKNHVLFGARASGKSTLISEQLENIILWDLLDDETYQRLLRDPKLIGQKIQNEEQIIVILGLSAKAFY